MKINKRLLGTFLWILSPVLLVLGIVWYMSYSLGTVLGPMDVQLLLLPLGSLLLAGIFSVVGYILYRPKHRIVRYVILVLYSVPVLLLAAYASYVMIYMAYHSGTDEEYTSVVIHGAQERIFQNKKIIFSVLNGCLSNWRGRQKDCDIKYYLLIVRDIDDNWTYTGGSVFTYQWTMEDKNGYFNEDSKVKKIDIELNRGPVITVSGHNVPLVPSELIVVKINSSWETSVARGTTALNNIKLTKFSRNFITSCVSGIKCAAK